MSFNTRLLKFINEHKLTPTGLARTLGYTSAEKIARLFRNDTTSPSYQIIKDILKKFPELNARWLIVGEELDTHMIKEPEASYGFCAECVKKDAIIKYQERIIKEKDQKIEELIGQCAELRGKLEQVTKNKAS